MNGGNICKFLRILKVLVFVVIAFLFYSSALLAEGGKANIFYVPIINNNIELFAAKTGSFGSSLSSLLIAGDTLIPYRIKQDERHQQSMLGGIKGKEMDFFPLEELKKKDDPKLEMKKREEEARNAYIANKAGYAENDLNACDAKGEDKVAVIIFIPKAKVFDGDTSKRAEVPFGINQAMIKKKMLMMFI